MPNIHAFTRELQKHRVQGDESTNGEYEYHNGSFGEYFRNKQIKLDTQAKEQFQQSSDIFNDCVIYITGYTVPSAMELKRIIVANGGQVCAFLGGKSYATHIVAATLTTRKTIEYTNYKVVKPAWVVESAKSGIRLDWTRYRTIATPGTDFFGQRDVKKGSEMPEIGEFEESAVSTELSELGDEMGEPGEEDETLENSDISNDFSLLDEPGPHGDEARRKWILEQRERTNCLDAEFISSYFAKSRLHFLSTRKLELRRRCRLYESPSPGTYSQKSLILHVDFDSFFVAVALKKRPDLIDKPVCVSNGSGSSDVASCNYIARKFGITNGSWVSNAKRKCPDLISLPYDFEEYVRCSDALYDSLFSLEPLHITAISVDEAIVDVSNLSIDISQVCEELRETVHKRTGIHVSVGVGSNILLARLALKKAKPAGFYIIAPEEIGGFRVRDLPGVGHHIEYKLRDLSVHTVADLCSVPLNVLQACIGKAHGQRLYDYSRAQDSSDVTSLDVQVRTIGLEIGWGVRLLDTKEKTHFVNNCVKELWFRIQKIGVSCETLTVKLYRKSKSAPFVPPKLLGHGLCDISSRSKKVSNNITVEGLNKVVHQLIALTPCSPVEMRGIGLHMRILGEQKPSVSDPKQSRITSEALAIQSPVTPSRPVIPLLPRKRRRVGGMTLTQAFPRKPTVIDPQILNELPTQIRREILINEDDYTIPEPNLENFYGSYYQITPFMDLSDAEIRRVLREWINSTSSPSAEDAKMFYDFICNAIEDSNWIRSMELVDWFGIHARKSDSEDWLYLHEILDDVVQQGAAKYSNDCA